MRVLSCLCSFVELIFRRAHHTLEPNSTSPKARVLWVFLKMLPNKIMSKQERQTEGAAAVKLLTCCALYMLCFCYVVMKLNLKEENGLPPFPRGVPGV